MVPCRTIEGTDPRVLQRCQQTFIHCGGMGVVNGPCKVLGSFNLEMGGKTGNPRQGISGWMSCSEEGFATKTGLTQWSPKKALSKALHSRSGQSEDFSARDP